MFQLDYFSVRLKEMYMQCISQLPILFRGFIDNILSTAYLSNFPNSGGISPSRFSQQMSCTLQILFFHECLPSRREACFFCLQSGGVVCPIPAKTRRSACQILVCSHPTLGRNLQSRPVASETPSNLHRLFSDHSTPQIRPDHQDRFCTLH